MEDTGAPGWSHGPWSYYGCPRAVVGDPTPTSWLVAGPGLLPVGMAAGLVLCVKFLWRLKDMFRWFPF